MSLQLFSYFRSSAAYRVRIALNLKEIEYQQTTLSLVQGEHRSADYLALNPQGLVPALRLDDGNVLTQSTAILEWLEETHPDPALYASDALSRAKQRALVNTIACDIHPLNNLRVLKYLKGELAVSDEAKNTWYQHWIALGFSAIEAQINTPFTSGDSPSMVDVYLVPQVYNALRFEQDMSEFPKIMQVYQACNELSAFERAAPEAQPDHP